MEMTDEEKLVTKLIQDINSGDNSYMYVYTTEVLTDII